MEPRTRRNIKYMVTPQAEKAGEDEINNPLSPVFMPLEERTEYGKARWWAMRSERKRKGQAEMDG